MKNEKNFMVEKIRTQYVEREYTELDELKALDRKVKRPATVFGYVLGSVSALVAGTGMSLVMTDIGSTIGLENSMALGIVIGFIGIALCAATYPIYKKILDTRKASYKERIIALADKITD